MLSITAELEHTQASMGHMLEKQNPNTDTSFLSNIRTTQAAYDLLYNLATIWHENQADQGGKWPYSKMSQYNVSIHGALEEWLVCTYRPQQGENTTDIPGAAASAAGGRCRQR